MTIVMVVSIPDLDVDVADALPVLPAVGIRDSGIHGSDDL